MDWPGLDPVISTGEIPHKDYRYEFGKRVEVIVDYERYTTATCPQHGEFSDCWPCVPSDTSEFCGACQAEVKRWLASRSTHYSDREPWDAAELRYDRLNPLEAGRGMVA